MLIDYAAITHLGRVRKNNEDAYLVSALDGEEPVVNGLRPLNERCRAGILAAVADGMGGAATGEIASREGLASVAVNLFGHWGRFADSAKAVEADLILALRTAAEAASAAVLRYADQERASRGMGSTLTAAVIWNGHAYLAQVGDSRAYLFRENRLAQITEDQTLMREMITAGSLTPEQARTHPQRSLITQALGCPTPIRAVLSRVALRRGDRLLLCSDGLHGEVPDQRLEEILAQGLTPAETLEVLVTEALAAGGRDNVTALILALDAPGLPLPMPGEGVRVTDVSPHTQPPDNDSFLSRLSRILRGTS
jgi:protein phosphatase